MTHHVPTSALTNELEYLIIAAICLKPKRFRLGFPSTSHRAERLQANQTRWGMSGFQTPGVGVGLTFFKPNLWR